MSAKRGSRRRRSRRDSLLVTCEHASPGVPAEYRGLFRGARALLASHRGWDPGALAVARRLATAFAAPLFATTTSRLLIDHNRSPGHPDLWSDRTRALPAERRARLLARHYWPHRLAVARCVAAAIGRGRRVIHIAVHSFTPALAGRVRRADVGLLYDPARPGEPALARLWQAALADARLRVRRNFPYRGSADGLTTWLRRRHACADYIGIELELNQRLLRTPAATATVARVVARALALALKRQSSGQDTSDAPTAASHNAGSARASSAGA